MKATVYILIPLEAISVIFGRRALIYFCLKALGKK